VGAQQLVQRLQHVADAQVLDFADRMHELAPEIAQDVLPLELAVGDEVELLLQVRREVVLHVALEKALQKRRDEAALVLGDQTLLVDLDVVALLQHGERGGIGRRTADAQLLHALDQRCLGEARRWLGEVLLGLDAPVLQSVALGKRRQAAAVILLGFLGLAVARPVVAAFLVELEEALEQHDRSSRPQPVGLAVPARRRNLGRGLLELGGRHLARHCALPDQLVEAGLVALHITGDLLWLAPHVGGADRLVGLLGILGLGFVLADEGAAGSAWNSRAPPALRISATALGDDRHAIGSHVGDEAGHLAVELDALVEALGHIHGLLGGEAQLARGLLLQGRGGEGGVGVAPHRLLLDRGRR
jgi:hypothetical protein